MQGRNAATPPHACPHSTHSQSTAKLSTLQLPKDWTGAQRSASSKGMTFNINGNIGATVVRSCHMALASAAGTSYDGSYELRLWGSRVSATRLFYSIHLGSIIIRGKPCRCRFEILQGRREGGGEILEPLRSSDRVCTTKRGSFA